MKNFFTRISLLAAISLSAFGISRACDRTDFTLNSWSFDAGTGRWTLNTTLCIGGGSLGGTQGGDNYTGTINFSFRNRAGETPTAPTIHSFSPAAITSDVLLRNSVGSTVAPSSTWPFGPEAGIVRYTVGTGTPTGRYICITPTSICGNPHTDCQTFTFVVSPLPDTIYALGIEGGGNPRAGCLTSDRPGIMLVTTNLPVVWASFDGYTEKDGVHLNFSTAKEHNNDYFSVVRSDDAENFVEIGQIDGAGNSNTLQQYSFIDHNPNQGLNYYKIMQYDVNGSTDETNVLTMNYTVSQGFYLMHIAPVPASDYVNVAFNNSSNDETTVEIYDMRGALVYQNTVATLNGYNTYRADVSGLNRGAYVVTLRSGNEAIRTRFVKQ